ASTGGTTGGGDTGTGGGAGATGTTVNINTADLAGLTTLSGVGEKTAQAIIDWREANGPFTAPEQLMEVKGIGPAKFEALRDAVSV
uniref:ComEA family DNA-binding protein n=1 Tax=Corynebacterium sp. TaxID=1720 RepID=UPI0025B7D5CF